MNKNISEIQLIRGFGIFVIMIGHMKDNLITWNNAHVKTFYLYFEGTTGLDVFFTLSGFVICRLLLNDLGKAQDRFHALQISCVFWLRRAWRLLPAAWLWLVLIVLLTNIANESGAFGSVRHAWGGALSAFLQVANFKFAHCWQERYFCGPSFPYWTLSFEEQFYIFLPLLMIFSGKWFLRVIVILAFSQFFIPALTLPAFFRLQGFMLGVLLAIWSQNPSYKIFEPVFLKRHDWVRRGVAFTLLALMCVTSTRLVPPSVMFQVSAIIGGLLVFLASFDQQYLWKPGLMSKVMLWFGDRAYTIYLCHIPVYYLTREIAYTVLGPEVKLGAQHFWYIVPGGFLLTIIASSLTYSLLEKPLRNRGMAISREMKEKQDNARESQRQETNPG